MCFFLQYILKMYIFYHVINYFLKVIYADIWIFSFLIVNSMLPIQSLIKLCFTDVLLRQLLLETSILAG